ncbi:dynamin family protein [Pacificoceanicola onchidii]|uniref:dynamin family protein n=1 Tax=Pacificoceanicola onchidii TaxID=2562685 RepID=UPI0010A4108A|nr:dynamin family protein [Pacificoceanicola onchidii]
MTRQDPAPAPLLSGAFSGFRPLADRLAALDSRLEEHAASQNAAIATRARQMRQKIREFEPSVTMIGQVKAGKTTLVNAMTGWRDMLPADVNPWTSVVTALHLQTGKTRATRNASFRFFTEDEWTHLLQRGGRMGELAHRAGADEEVDKVRAQLEVMREKSRERLGRRFELLLGQSHDYDNFNAELIERYVCLGDDFWESDEISDQRGRFADITRTADLWFAQPDLPLNLCIRDTPGVNDTFMIREQITINALRGSRLCVMVLAATQALTTVDLALIRMISNVASRDVIIFVNRIDELADPAREVPEIRTSILDTLRKHGGPAEAEIIFGCGAWASEAIAGGIEGLAQPSAEALLNWAEHHCADHKPFESLEEMVWMLSGLQALGQAIATRIEAGAGAQLLQELETEAGNLDQSQTVAEHLQTKTEGAARGCTMTPDTLATAFDAVEQSARQALIAGIEPLQHAFIDRIDASRKTFVARATEAVIRHLEMYGELEVYTYDPSGLRVLLRSGYQRHVRAVGKHGVATMAAAAAEISALYEKAFDLGAVPPEMDPPPLPQAAPPIVLGQTIALDLRGTWWSRFWRRRKGYDACADDFARLIHDETQPMLNRLVSENAQHFEDAVIETLGDYLATHRKILLGMAEAASDAPTPAPQRRTASGVDYRLEAS